MSLTAIPCTAVTLAYCRRAGLRRGVSAGILSIWLFALLACSFGIDTNLNGLPAAVDLTNISAHAHQHPGSDGEQGIDDLCCDLLQLPTVASTATVAAQPIFKVLICAPVLLALLYSVTLLPLVTCYRYSHPPNTKPFLRRIANFRWPNAPPHAAV